MRNPTWTLALAAGFAAGLAGSLVFSLLRGDPAPADSAEEAAVPGDERASPAGPGAKSLSNRLDSLARRVATLEAGLPADGRSALPAPPASNGAGGGDALQLLSDRLARIEEAQQKLEEAVAEGAAAPRPAGERTLEEIQDALAAVRAGGSIHDPERRDKRIELRTELLRRQPDAAGAGDHLVGLVSDHLRAQDAQQALAALDEFGHRVDIERWRLEKSYAGVYGYERRFDEERASYERVAGDSTAPEGERASALFFHAYSYYQEGRTDDAREAFEYLLSAFAGSEDAGVTGTLGAAKSQLEKLPGGENP